jgi:hypothetical protein
LAVSWKPFENSNASTRRKQKPSNASAVGEPAIIDESIKLSR